MTRRLRLTESNPTSVSLSEEQADQLEQLGRRLASDTRWSEQADQAQGDDGPASVIVCRPDRGGRWLLTVREAVGLVAVEGLEVAVEPKIPMAHLLYLMSRGGYLPRLDTSPTEVAPDVDLWFLVANWFISRTEELLQLGLRRGYEPRRDDLPIVRGRVDTLQTARSFSKGRLRITCEFDEFALDTPLNRILKAAARTVAAAQSLPGALRRRGRTIAERFRDLGDVQRTDMQAFVERHTLHYRDAVELGKQLLRGVGRTPTSGERRSWAFLLRTPEPIEAGIRDVLTEWGGPMGLEISKRTVPADVGPVTFTPDLVIDGPLTAVGDVKYSLPNGSWNRPTLYQLMTFATAFDAPVAFAVTPADTAAALAPDFSIQGKHLSHIAWWTGLEPPSAAEQLTRDVGQLLIQTGILGELTAVQTA